MIAVLVYMNSVISSINKCEKNQTASCPTFSNPNSITDDTNYKNYTYYALPDGNLKPLLVDHTYNQGFSHEKITRVNNWKHIYQVVNGNAKENINNGIAWVR